MGWVAPCCLLCSHARLLPRSLTPLLLLCALAPPLCNARANEHPPLLPPPPASAHAQSGHITIWTDVDGVYSADPRKVPEAVCLKHLR